MTVPLVDIKNLKIRRGEKIVLELDQLCLARGEVLSVVGPNGAGKSTLLLALARLILPEAGQILFNGKQAEAESDKAYRRRVAFVMQDPLLFDTSVLNNVASGLRFRKTSKDIIKEKVPQWLERLGVAHLADRRASQLSGGEAQRVSLARALVLEPELLLLDEPFSSLDPPTRANILDDLEVLLSETQTTTIFVTHDLHEARQLSRRMAIVIAHRLRQVGQVDALFESPADSEVEAFLNHKTAHRAM